MSKSKARQDLERYFKKREQDWSKFKVGDRVALYNQGLRFIDVVSEIGMIGDLRIGKDLVWYSQKQCRLLKRKKEKNKIRIWADPKNGIFKNYSSSDSAWICISRQPREGFIEFAEVKKCPAKEKNIP